MQDDVEREALVVGKFHTQNLSENLKVTAGTYGKIFRESLHNAQNQGV